MTDRNEALRLADELDAEVVRTVQLDVTHTKAAALLRQLSAERDQLRAEVERLRADADRLDHIEKHARCDPKMDGQHVWWPTNFNHALRGPNLRAAIDNARTTHKDEG